MTFLEKLQVIERVDGLIRRKSTGTADELASKLGVSRRCVYNIINLMKKMDAPIEYNAIRRSYFYSSECHFTFGFVNKKKIEGGIFIDFASSADLMHNYGVILKEVGIFSEPFNRGDK